MDSKQVELVKFDDTADDKNGYVPWFAYGYLSCESEDTPNFYEYLWGEIEELWVSVKVELRGCSGRRV